MPLGWIRDPKFKKLPNQNFSSISSVNVAVTTEGRVSPVYHPEARAQGTSSELNLDQQYKLQRLKSKPSQLSRGPKPPSNASADSFYTAAVPEREDTAKTFAERAWQEDPDFVEREKLVEWLGALPEIRQQALVHYMAHFNFGGIDVDEAIRLLCNKLYIKGETQQIDRILGAFSEHYMSQNPNSLWKSGNIVHVVSFAIILLNTDLQATELPSHIRSSGFVDNTIEAVRAQLQKESMASNSPVSNDIPMSEPLPDIDELPQPHSPSTILSGRASSPPNVERRAFNRNRLSSIGSLPMRDSWVVASHPLEAVDNSSDSNVLDERWISEISRELATIYGHVRARPILQTKHDEPATSPQSKTSPGLLKRGGAKLYHSLRGESPYAQSSPSASGASFVSALGHRVSSSMSSLPHFLGLTSNQSLPSSASTDPSKSPDSPWAKTGLLLWKSVKPTAGRMAKPKRWLSVTAIVRSSTFDMSGPAPPGSNPGTGRRLGTLSLLHTLAIELPAPKGIKVRSFGLTLASGETHVFEIQAVSTSMLFKSKSKPSLDSDIEILAWVRACNYHAARYSRAPLPDAVTNVEYGWNGAATNEDDQSSINGRTRNTLIDDWVAPTLPTIEVQSDAKTQLEVWNRQVKLYNAEFTEHGELRGRMMSLYRHGSAQAQKAMSNWEKKAQYLQTEIIKYETYAEILKNTELASQELT